MPSVNPCKFSLRLALVAFLCLALLNVFKVSPWCDGCQGYTQLISLGTEIHCDGCGTVHTECQPDQGTPVLPGPEQLPLPLNGDTDSDSFAISKPRSIENVFFLGGADLLEPQAIYLDVLFPPPDYSFVS